MRVIKTIGICAVLLLAAATCSAAKSKKKAEIGVCRQEICHPHPGVDAACYCFKSNDTQTECRPTIERCRADATLAHVN